MPDTTAEVLKTRCCIAGGGPAGMMLGFLLARAGIDVVVLEKLYTDFLLATSRGDTIHPSTLEVRMFELPASSTTSWKRPHQEVKAGGRANRRYDGHDRRFLPRPHPLQVHGLHAAVGLPQLPRRAWPRRYPAFHLRMEAQVVDLIEESGRVVRRAGK